MAYNRMHSINFQNRRQQLKQTRTKFRDKADDSSYASSPPLALDDTSTHSQAMQDHIRFVNSLEVLNMGYYSAPLPDRNSNNSSLAKRLDALLDKLYEQNKDER